MKQNSIELFQGDNRMIRVYVKDENLDIINLNGAEARFIVAENSFSTSFLLRKTTLNFQEGVVRTPELGEVVFFINTDDTKNWEPSQYFYQVVVYLKNGMRYTVADGVLNLRKNVEFGEIIPVVPTDMLMIEIPSGSNFIDISISPLEMIIPVLIAPNGSVDNISITNILYSPGAVRIYFSAQILEDGWKVSYVVHQLG